VHARSFADQVARGQDEIQQGFQQIQDRLRQSHADLNQAVQQERAHSQRIIEQNRETLQNTVGRLQGELGRMEEWTRRVHELPIWNFFIGDMQWVTENIKNIAFDRAKSKVQQIMEALYQKHNYHGMIQQILFLPFLEKHGKQHLND
jgi:hypothetical protein